MKNANAPSRLPLDPKHSNFIKWAEEQGIEVNGIEPANLEGRGTGIVASRALKKGEIVFRASSTNFITANTNWVSSSDVRGGTVHGLLATSLTLSQSDPNRYFKPWQAVWPSLADLKASVPLLWPPELQKLLPPRSKAYLEEQQGRLDRDWEASASALPEGSYLMFRYFWLIVNTRCFFWPHNRWPPRNRKYKRGRPPAKLSSDDQMALCPIADYFNHSDTLTASFESDVNGCWISVEQDLNAGEEIFFRYATQNNDYLLVEYGFVLSTNRDDNVNIDDAILPWLDENQKALLQEYNYFGKYTLSEEGVCHRTQCAIRTILHSDNEDNVKSFLSGDDDGTAQQPHVDAWILDMLRDCLKRTSSITANLENMDESPQGNLLLKRYLQMTTLFVELMQSGQYS